MLLQLSESRCGPVLACITLPAELAQRMRAVGRPHDF